MGDRKKIEVGSITWADLTVKDADRIQSFYSAVVGWKPEPVRMGGYEDFAMTGPENGAPVAGVCHARGVNADLPAQWLVYINVTDVDASAARCEELGGRIIAGPREMGSHGRYCVIQDPAGAVAALFQPAS